MKGILLTIFGLLGTIIIVQGQTIKQPSDTMQVVLDNEQMTVTEYVSTPGKDVCGADKHSHPAHLSILLTDAMVQLTGEDGKAQSIDLKSGTTFWSEEETHTVVNTGDEAVRVYLVELKK